MNIWDIRKGRHSKQTETEASNISLPCFHCCQEVKIILVAGKNDFFGVEKYLRGWLHSTTNTGTLFLERFLSLVFLLIRGHVFQRPRENTTSYIVLQTQLVTWRRVIAEQPASARRAADQYWLTSKQVTRITFLNFAVFVEIPKTVNIAWSCLTNMQWNYHYYENFHSKIANFQTLQLLK